MAAASAGADGMERVALQQDFADAVRHFGTKAGLEVSEAVQRRLFGLHARATRGAPPESAPPDLHEEQWKAWAEAADVSEEAAMKEYIALVTQIDPEFLTGGSGDEEMPASELPPALKQQLADAGFNQPSPAGSRRQAATVHEAARAGSGLCAFLPAHCDVADADGLTPLIHAVDAEQGESVAELLLAGASPDKADSQGATPLHYAGLLGNAALAEQLLAAGADPRLRDEDGLSPADTAQGEGHAELAEALREAIAKFQG